MAWLDPIRRLGASELSSTEMSQTDEAVGHYPITSRAHVGRPLACVMGGGMDLVRPLGLAGIDCAVATNTGAHRFIPASRERRSTATTFLRRRTNWSMLF